MLTYIIIALKLNLEQPIGEIIMWLPFDEARKRFGIMEDYASDIYKVYDEYKEKYESRRIVDIKDALKQSAREITKLISELEEETNQAVFIDPSYIREAYRTIRLCDYGQYDNYEGIYDEVSNVVGDLYQQFKCL